MKTYLTIDSKTSIQRNSAWPLIKISIQNRKISRKENVLFQPNCRTNYSSLGWAQNALIRDIHKQFGKDIIISKQLLEVIKNVSIYFTALGNVLLDFLESSFE